MARSTHLRTKNISYRLLAPELELYIIALCFKNLALRKGFKIKLVGNPEYEAKCHLAPGTKLSKYLLNNNNKITRKKSYLLLLNLKVNWYEFRSSGLILEVNIHHEMDIEYSEAVTGGLSYKNWFLKKKTEIMVSPVVFKPVCSSESSCELLTSKQTKNTNSQICPLKSVMCSQGTTLSIDRRCWG